MLAYIKQLNSNTNLCLKNQHERSTTCLLHFFGLSENTKYLIPQRKQPILLLFVPRDNNNNEDTRGLGTVEGPCTLAALPMLGLIKLTGWKAQQVSNEVNKAALFYVEQTVIAYICFTCDPKCFYWLVVHLHFNTFCVLCRVKANEQTKIENKQI